MSYDEGQQLEVYFSLLLHQKVTPLLVSPLLLREIGAGQIDIAFYSKREIHIFEIKKSGLISFKQVSRLRHSGNWLANLLGSNCHLWLAKKLLPKGHSFTNLNS